jgi:hypothetical protein
MNSEEIHSCLPADRHAFYDQFGLDSYVHIQAPGLYAEVDANSIATGFMVALSYYFSIVPLNLDLVNGYLTLINYFFIVPLNLDPVNSYPTLTGLVLTPAHWP